MMPNRMRRGSTLREVSRFGDFLEMELFVDFMNYPSNSFVPTFDLSEDEQKLLQLDRGVHTNVSAALSEQSGPCAV